MKNREIIKKKQIFIIKHNNNIKYIKINMANNLLFKGIQQVKALPSNPVNGVIYFVREFTDGNPNGNAKIYFGNRLYGEVPTSRLAELQTAIEKNQTDIAVIKGIIGTWTADMRTIAQAVVDVSGATQTNASEINNLKTLVGENNVSESINRAKTEAINTSTGYTQTQINNLDTTVSGKSAHVTVNVVEENGIITTVDVSEENIASNSDLTTHANNVGIHITADERTNWNDTKDTLDAFLLNSDATTDAIDTLKEIQDFLTSDTGTVKQLLDDVSTNATNIETLTNNFNTHSAKTEIHVTTQDKAKWNDAEVNAKSYTDGLLGGGFSSENTVSSVIEGINNRLTTITDNAVTSVASSGKTITVTENAGAVNVEVNTLEHAESGQDGYVILQKNSLGQLYGVMYYGGDDAK